MKDRARLLSRLSAFRAGKMCRYRADLSAAGSPHASVRCKAHIVGGFETAEGERAHFGVRLDLPPMDA